MEETIVYEPDTAESLFEELQESSKLVPDFRQAYSALRQLFLRVLNQHTQIPGIRFGGAFAKTDYLLKEHQAPASLRRDIHDARVRFRKLGGEDSRMLADNYWYDFKAVCQFVACVLHVPVPTFLESRFPQHRTVRSNRLTAVSLRVIVERWDDTYLYAVADEAGIGEMKIHYGGLTEENVYKTWDWTYLRNILTPRSQLNLVFPREKDGVIYPELIIFEPDYLVDISAVAACFEQYSDSPLNHLLNKLKPAANTSATLLGLLAGQFLDETLSLYPDDRPYAESVQTFFKDHALSLLTADLASDFHQSAKNQKLNIQHIVREVLPEVFKNDGIRRFDTSEIVLEPSFFSEMLGLQGRMDFLQRDQKIVIEQKSGKAAFPERIPPLPLLKHQVQLMLYTLLLRYNYRETYEKNGRNLHSLLLYSKYAEGLVAPGYAPDLVFSAIRTRNQLVAQEFGFTRGEIGILETLTADSMNTHHVTGPLWERYQKPQIESLLSPIRCATPLERSYYFRFLTFLETEHLLSKVGNQTKENSGFADKWNSTLEDKLQAGNIYHDLDLLSPAESEQGRVEQLVLGYASHAATDDSAEGLLPVTNFRKGDIVICYPYAEGEEPDARRTMVYRATIERLETHRLVLHLRAAQTNVGVFNTRIKADESSNDRRPRMKWAVEHDFFDSSYSSLYRAMHAFLSAPQERKDLLLLQREPKCDKSQQLKGHYDSFDELALKAKQAQDLFLIIGPPGTGKTSYGLMNVLKEELLTSQSSVLLLSFTNRAVDEICSKLTESDISFIRIGSRFSCDEAYRPSLLENKSENCKSVGELRRLILDTRVFVGTTTAFYAHLDIFRLKQFSLAIVDEASQILEPYLIGLFSATTPIGGGKSDVAIRKFVLIGDHKQLPAVVQQTVEESRVDDPQLNAIHLTDCRNSLFERLLRQYRDKPEVVYMLTSQGRMHPDVAAFPNQAFYRGLLKIVPMPHQQEQQAAFPRFAFVEVRPTARVMLSASRENSDEAQAIASVAMEIYRQTSQSFSPEQTLGIIVPYRNQIAEIRKAIALLSSHISHPSPLSSVTIDTVERFQGSQRDYIFYGFTVSRPHQLQFLAANTFMEDGQLIDRKLNVALTRARKHLFVFGNPDVLNRNPVFRQLIGFAKSHNCYFTSVQELLHPDS